MAPKQDEEIASLAELCAQLVEHMVENSPLVAVFRGPRHADVAQEVVTYLNEIHYRRVQHD